MKQGDSNLQSSFNCIDNIEQVISRTTAKQYKPMKIIADSIETQREDLRKMAKAIMGLASTLSMSRAMQRVTTTSINVSNEETLLKNQNGSNGHCELCQKRKMAPMST